MFPYVLPCCVVTLSLLSIISCLLSFRVCALRKISDYIPYGLLITTVWFSSLVGYKTFLYILVESLSLSRKPPFQSSPVLPQDFSSLLVIISGTSHLSDLSNK